MARLALAAMLFTQAALAVAACESDHATSAIAHSEDRAAAPCHEPEDNPNLCLVHCLNGDQSLDKPLLKIPALAPTLVFSLALAVECHRDAFVPRRMSAPHVAGPPIRLLFQSLLI